MKAMTEQVLQLELFSTGGPMSVPITRVLNDIQTPFQHVLVADSPTFGRCLVIDDVMQLSEHDHDIYDAGLLRMLRSRDKKILVLGGGDGFIAQKVIRTNPAARVIVVDLDIEVVNSVKQYFQQTVFDSDRVQLFVGDARHFTKVQTEKFDGVVCDLTDSPIGADGQRQFVEFYDDIFSHIVSNLNKYGWVAVQGGASAVAEGHINQAVLLQSLLDSKFFGVERMDLFIPSFGESCAFLYARNPKPTTPKGQT